VRSRLVEMVKVEKEMFGMEDGTCSSIMWFSTPKSIAENTLKLVFRFLTKFCSTGGLEFPRIP
jgi:hypothetical protein